MAEHHELVHELEHVEKMSTQERLKHARKRRQQQLKKYSQYDKQMDKEKKKPKKNQHNKKKDSKQENSKPKRNIYFISNVMLLEAAARNDIKEVRDLLKQRVSPDVTNEDGLTALHQCCIDDYENMMKVLLEFGANVNATDSEQWTPLHAAATCGHVHLCKYLINHGAELLSVNADGNMPYDICEDDVTLDFIETEMSVRGITQEMIDDTRLLTEKAMLTDMKTLYKEQGNFDYKDKHGASALHIATANGYIDVVEYLLSNNCPVHLMDNDEWQPVHAAACWGHLSILETLVHHGADLEARTKTGETPLEICEDPEIQRRIVELKEEVRTHRTTRNSVEQRHRRSINPRRPSLNAITQIHPNYWSSSFANSASSIYNSNTSLSSGPNPFSTRRESLTGSNKSPGKDSASVRRTSMREKTAISRKEARDEAKIRDSIASDEDRTNYQQSDVQSTNIDDVTLHLSDMRTTAANNQDGPKPPEKMAHMASSEAMIYPVTKMSGSYAEDSHEPVALPREPSPPPKQPTPPPREPTPPPREPTPPPREPSPPAREASPPARVKPGEQKKPVPADRKVAPVKPQPQDKPKAAVRQERKHHHENNNDKHKTHESRNNNDHGKRREDNARQRQNTTEIINAMNNASDVAIVAPQQQPKPEPKPSVPQPEKPDPKAQIQQHPPMQGMTHLSWNPSGMPPTGTLADLKKHRRLHGQRGGSIDAGLNNKLGSSNGDLHDGDSNGVPATVTYTPSGLSTTSVEHRKRYTATMDSEIIGTDESKQSCCVIL